MMRNCVLCQNANNNGADQPAHPHSLYNWLLRKSAMYIYYIQSFKILASFCSWAGWFESKWLQIFEDTYSRDVTQMVTDTGFL